MQPRYTRDISELALDRYHTACQALLADKLALAGVLYAESGWYASAHNPNGDASGLFQAMPSTLYGLGFRPDLLPKDRATAFRALDLSEQISWLRRYYAPYRGQLYSTARCYVATFLPAELTHAGDPDYILAQRSGYRGAVYLANAAFDANRDYTIQVKELAQAVHKATVGARWDELVERITEGSLRPVSNSSAAPGSILGLQQALTKLGYSPGPQDGVFGVLTHSAVKAYQTDHKLQVDGIYGPLTRKSLEETLRAKGLT